MIKNATVQLPEIQVVKKVRCDKLQACDTAHTAREAMEEAPAFFLAALDGDAETVSKMLSAAGAQSFINYQHALGDTPLLTALGATPLLAAAANGHVAVTEQLLQAPCNVDLQMQGGVSRSFLDRYFELASLIEARCSIDVPNVHGMTALHAAERMGHTAIPTLIRNTRQKIAESIVRQAEEERLGLVALLAAVPQEDWCRTWPACRTIMFRRTSKIVKEQVDKMRLPAVVCLCELWRDGINRSPVGGGRPNKMENVQIVINQLPLMTAWCRITTLKLHVLYPSDFRGDRSPETFAGVLEGVLGQSTGSLTDLDLDSNCLGSDGVRRLAGVLSQCTLLRYLVLAATEEQARLAGIKQRQRRAKKLQEVPVVSASHEDSELPKFKQSATLSKKSSSFLEGPPANKIVVQKSKESVESGESDDEEKEEEVTQSLNNS